MTIPDPAAREVVRSPQNAAVRALRALDRDRDLREREGLYLAWGIHLAQEGLAAGVLLKEAWVGPALDGSAEGRAVQSDLLRAGVRLIRATTRVLESIIPGSGDQGVLLLVRRVARSLDDVLAARPSLVLLAQGVQDPGNLGSIARTAKALGGEALVVLEGCADPFGSRAVRAAMGAQFTLPVASSALGVTLAAVARSGLRIVASDPAADEPPHAVDLRPPTAVFVGGEGAGLSGEILERAWSRVRIPMAAGVDSLNVHAAAAALLYEAARQRGFAGLH